MSLKAARLAVIEAQRALAAAEAEADASLLARAEAIVACDGGDLDETIADLAESDAEDEDRAAWADPSPWQERLNAEDDRAALFRNEY